MWLGKTSIEYNKTGVSDFSTSDLFALAGDLARINLFPACISVATVHELSLFIQNHLVAFHEVSLMGLMSLLF